MSIHPVSSSSYSQELPLMGFGTFIAIEEKAAETQSERQRITEETVFEALKAGYRHFDCAAGYNNEEWVGNAFQKAFLPVSDGGLGLSRGDLYITTKGGSASLDESLEKLGIDYSDLHLCHFPTHFTSKAMLVEEWTLMNDHVNTGKAKRIGVSNHYQPHLERLLAVCDESELEKPYANEIELNPKLQEEKFVSFCQTQGIHVIAYCPLGYCNRALCLNDETILAIAKDKLATPAQITLAWNMKRGVSVIPKSSSAERMRENLGALKFIDQLNAEDMKLIKAIDWEMHSTATSENWKSKGLGIKWHV